MKGAQRRFYSLAALPIMENEKEPYHRLFQSGFDDVSLAPFIGFF